MERPAKPGSKSPPLLNGQERTRRTTIRPRSINYLKLIIAFQAFQAFQAFGKAEVLLHMDNITAVSYVNQKGGMSSGLFYQLTILMWTW